MRFARLKFLSRLRAAFFVPAIFGLMLAWGASIYPPTPAHAQFVGQGTFVNGTGGTADAQTLSIPNVGSYNDLIGVPITVISSFGGNTGPMTVNVNNLGPVPLHRIVTNPGLGFQDLGPGGFMGGVMTVLIYDGAQFTLATNNDMTPVGATIDLRMFTAGLPVGYLVEDGSCKSRTVFKTLFAVIGTTYGACDGSTTFAVSDSRGTAVFALDNQGSNGTAGRITTANSGCSGQSLITCGSASHTLTLPELPSANLTLTGNPITPSFTGTPGLVAVTTVSTNIVTADNTSQVGAGGGGTGVIGTSGGNVHNGAQGSTGTFTPVGAVSTFTPSGTIYNGGANVPHPILNPASFATRAIKY